MKVFTLKDNVFKTEPVVVANCSYPEFVKWVKARYPKYEQDNDMEGVAGTAVKLFDKNGSCGRIIWVKRLSKKPEDIGVLLHELFHLVVRVMQDKGVPIVDKLNGEGFSWNGDESAAYLYESYAVQSLEKIK